MMKRIIALLLALILTVGLLPTVALAAGETGADTAPADVIDGYYDDNNEWTKGELKQSAVPGVQTVSKTAKPTANPNEYEVTLKVVLKQTSETKTGAAATALVLDCSGSMDWCTECGQDWCRHKTDDTYNVTFDVHNSNSYYVIENGKYVRVSYCDGYHFLSSCDGGAGWYTSDRKRDHKSQNKLTPKISQTDSAATHVQFYTRTEGSFDTSRMTAAKNAAKNFLKTYSGFDASVIKDDGSLKDTAKDLSIKRYVAVIRFSNNIDNDTDSSSWWEGEDYKPAWYDVSTVVGYNKVLATINNASAGGGTNLDAGLTTASSLMDADLVKNLTSKNVIALTDGAPTYSKSYGDGGSTNQDICNETAKTAETLRVKSKVYTVCFAAESESLYDGGGTVGNFLKERIATQPAEGSNEKYAYNAKSAEDLIKVFKDITDTIVSGLNNGTVKDSLPTGITSTDFGNATQFELNDQKQFHKDVKTETVDGKEVTTYTYTKTYTVKIDPKTVKTENVDGVDYAPLNGETTLTVKNGDENVTIHFPIPAGKVTMPSYTVTYTDGVDSEVVFENVEKTAAYKAAIPAYGDSNPTRTGYTFTDWKWYNATDTTYANEITPAPTTMPAYNLVAVAQWTPATNTKYIVEHYLQNLTDNGYTKQETETKDGTTGATATAAAKTYTGFMFDEDNASNVKSGTIAADGSLVLKLYYTRNSYKVTYDYGTAPAGASTLPDEATYKYGATVTVAAKATAPGYDFDGWKKDGNVTTSFEMPADNVTLTGTWTAKSDTAYQVKHYLQNLTDDGYTLAETETKSGTTGAQTEAVAKSYTGFTVQPFNQKTIAADGTTVVEIHYNRNTYKVTYDYGTAPAGASTLPTEATYKYGAMVTVAAKATAPGYDFDGWKKDGTVTTSFEMPAQNVTLTGSWTLKDPTAVNVDLNNHIYKTFTSDTADIPNGKLTFNVTVSGKSDNAASMTRRGSVEFTKQDVTTSKAFTFAGDPLTFTAAGEYTFEVVEDTTTTINGLTYNVGNGTHTFTIVVDKKANTNELEVKEVRVGTAEYTGNALTAELAYATITNNYVEPKKTFDLNNTIFKTFTPVAGGLPIPTGEGISYTFTARMTEQTEEGFAVGSTGRNYTLKATLTGEVIEANKVPFTVEGASEVSFAPGTYYFLVQEDSTAAVTGTVNGTIHNDSQAYLLTLTVKEDLSFETEVKETAVAMSLEEPTPGLGTVTFNNTYEEKEPGKYTINFSNLIVKCLTKEGSKAFTGAEFTANVTGWKYMKEEAKPWAMLANATSFAFTDLPSRTLTATFLADAVFNPDNEAYRPFTGDTLTVEEGDYLFLIEENNGGQSNITYDEAKYWLAVRVRFANDEPIVAVYRRTYTAGDSYNTIFENETKWSDPIPANITPVTFYNTIDTGKDDYYPIIIPTIINKDTGMLNKTDHFAYVIGYPDGTVHPNGQITRAEVATIFFRLLRDEVRDGAFTTSNTYSDVAYGKWYNNPISTMSALGIITGYPDGTFKPNKPITRAEFAAIAARFDETQSGKSATFSDVIGHWAAKEIGIAYYNDWIKGYPDGTFKPDQNITRAEAMTLINRVLERKPESPADLLTNMNKWTDNLDTSKWYYLDVQEATNSHAYTRKTFNYELWRQMLPDPDWSRYER